MLNTRKATSLYNNKICKFVVGFVFILYSFVLIVQIFLEPIVSDVRKQFQRLTKNGLSNIKLFAGRFILKIILSLTLGTCTLDHYTYRKIQISRDLLFKAYWIVKKRFMSLDL